MTCASATHPGLVRQNNEDCILTDDTLGIYLLADGIGGHNAGEVASALAVETVYGVLRSNLIHTAVDDYYELMVHAIQTAHWEISSKAITSELFNRMGTTLAVAVVLDNKAYIVHAGDSRCYLFQSGPYPHLDPLLENEAIKIQRLTHDHTVGDQLLASGVAVEEIPKKQFHTLTQSVGCGDPPLPDFNVIEFKQGDVLLICSDGLTDMLSDAEIETILSQGSECLDSLAEKLISAANANGGRDNISVILVASP
jgi:protein phosphatase